MTLCSQQIIVRDAKKWNKSLVTSFTHIHHNDTQRKIAPAFESVSSYPSLRMSHTFCLLLILSRLYIGIDAHNSKIMVSITLYVSYQWKKVNVNWYNSQNQLSIDWQMQINRYSTGVSCICLVACCFMLPLWNQFNQETDILFEYIECFGCLCIKSVSIIN